MTVSRPKSVAEAVSTYGRETNSLVLAGGTDVMVLWNLGLFNRRSVLDISAISEWTKITAQREGLSLGALATHSQIRRHPAVLARFPLLAQACATIGAVQIQNRGTIGGNLANASPAGDTFPALAVYEPVVHAISTRGKRVIPFQHFFTGVKKTSLSPGELIASVELHDPGRKPDRQYIRKVGTRAAQAISKTVGAGLLWLNKDKTVAELRFALGSVAPTVRRLRASEEMLKGKRLTPDIISEACRLVEDDISPIDDIRSTRDYRLAVSRNMLREFLEGRNKS
jgi:CO/xanthine dehydrogenase FAD-binding subunit